MFVLYRTLFWSKGPYLSGSIVYNRTRYEIEHNFISGNKVKFRLLKIGKHPLKLFMCKQIIGLCGYHHMFIENFAKIAAPFYALLKKDIKWNFVSFYLIITWCSKTAKQQLTYLKSMK